MLRSVPGTEEYKAFAAAVHTVNEQLAKAIAGDGEGATALLEVEVVGAADKEQAKKSASQSFARI